MALDLREATQKCSRDGRTQEADTAQPRKKVHLRYDTCLDLGYPIATGVIKGACRYLVKDRLDITGARWSVKGAEAVLKIRALKSSNDIEEYFRFHKLQDREGDYPYFAAISHKKAA